MLLFICFFCLYYFSMPLIQLFIQLLFSLITLPLSGSNSQIYDSHLFFSTSIIHLIERELLSNELPKIVVFKIFYKFTNTIVSVCIQLQ